MSLSRGLLLLIGPLLSACGVWGMWRTARVAERDLLRRSDAALAVHAIRYLSVVTPAGPDGGYDTRRLLSAANALADASFWPGGFQLALGQVPLVLDTIELAPLPASVVSQLQEGASSVVTTHARIETVVVPFPDRDHIALLGWAATWRTLRTQLPSAHASLVTLLAIGGIVAAAAGLWSEHTARWRLIVFTAAMGLVTVLAIDLGWSVYRTARVGSDTRLLTVRRLVEIAATAEGVKQSRLPELGAGTTVRLLRRPVPPSEDVIRDEEDGEPVARIVAATPRTQGGIAFSLRPMEEDLGELWLGLLAWLGLSALALALSAWAGRALRPPAAGLSGHAAVLHTG
jgi:antitoxin (DNA-binding transcriptional repressor) of toxin-antitoxin stability system